MYQLFLDKQNHFTAQVRIQGTGRNNANARIIVEGKQNGLIYPAKVDDYGRVSVNIDGLAHMYNIGDTGKITLEVVANDLVFTPWAKDFKIEKSNTTIVETKDVSITVIDEPENKALAVVKKLYSGAGITIHNLNESLTKRKLQRIHEFAMTKYPDLAPEDIINNVDKLFDI